LLWKGELDLKRTLLCALLPALLIGCGPDSMVKRDGEILDVPYEISILAESGGRQAGSLAGKAVSVMEKRFKLLQPDRGEIGRLNEDRTLTDLNPEVARVLLFADSMRQLTNGMYDYRFGALRNLWEITEEEPKPPSPAELEAALAKCRDLRLTVEGSRASLSGEGPIDLGDVAAGWAVDGAAETLIKGGVGCAIIRFGNVTRLWGVRDDTIRWRMDFAPPPGDSTWYVLTPPDGAFCSYGKGINGFQYLGTYYPRLLDPRDGMPSDSAITVASYAPDAASAGALAPALFVMGKRIAFQWLNANDKYGIFIVHRIGAQRQRVAETSFSLLDCLTDSTATEE